MGLYSPTRFALYRIFAGACLAGFVYHAGTQYGPLVDLPLANRVLAGIMALGAILMAAGVRRRYLAGFLLLYLIISTMPVLIYGPASESHAMPRFLTAWSNFELRTFILFYVLPALLLIPLIFTPLSGVLLPGRPFERSAQPANWHLPVISTLIGWVGIALCAALLYQFYDAACVAGIPLFCFFILVATADAFRFGRQSDNHQNNKADALSKNQNDSASTKDGDSAVDAEASRSNPEPDRAIVFFDGFCGLCNQSVDYLMLEDRHRRLRYAPLQGETAAGLLPERMIKDLDSMTYYDARGPVQKSQAFIRIGQRLGGFWRCSVLLYLIPRPLRDGMYDWIARHRYEWFGQKESCRLPTPEERGLILE